MTALAPAANETWRILSMACSRRLEIWSCARSRRDSLGIPQGWSLERMGLGPRAPSGSFMKRAADQVSFARGTPDREDDHPHDDEINPHGQGLGTGEITSQMMDNVYRHDNNGKSLGRVKFLEVDLEILLPTKPRKQMKDKLDFELNHWAEINVARRGAILELDNDRSRKASTANRDLGRGRTKSGRVKGGNMDETLHQSVSGDERARDPEGRSFREGNVQPSLPEGIILSPVQVTGRGKVIRGKGIRNLS